MFDPSVKLPAGLEVSAIGREIEYTERALNDRDFIDLNGDHRGAGAD